jgi:peroxiredoxin
MKRVVLALAIVLCTNQLIFGAEPISPKSTGKAKPFELTDTNGSRVSLSDFKNQPVMLFFWTTWCPYCREELKTLNAQYAQLQKDGIAVLPINVGEDQSKVTTFAKSRNLTVRIFLDKDTKVSGSYEVVGVPTYLLIDKEGNIRFQGHTFPQKELKGL